jgi:hypothetical protein
MVMRAILLLLILLTLMGTVAAETNPDQGSADKLHKYCGPGKSSWMESYCFRLVTGLLEKARANNDRLGGLPVCPPKEVTKGEVVDVVKAWLADHPEDRGQSAETQIARALSRAWPCG